ncbi:MAG: hypothetical protein IJ214_02245 [Clostridia bacterium]|nr:hypothetical protein [Clostridia bacterium]
MRDMVLILNFDNAGSRAVARALRAEMVYCKVVPPDIAREQVESQQPMGLILAGGISGSIPSGIDERLLSGEWPVLALGDTAAMLCQGIGGSVLETALDSGIGAVSFIPGPLTEEMDSCERMLRGVRRLRLPESFQVLAQSQDEVVGFAHASLPLYGIQFSLEPNDTDGMRLLLNFALRVCGCTRWWNFDIYIDRTVSELQRLVGDGQAICTVTGGLNSGVAAVLAHRALGSRLQCVFIDTGLMRENEGQQVHDYYRDRLGLNVYHVPAGNRFLKALEGVSDPAEKRRVIHETLQTVLDETMAQLGNFTAILRSTTANDLMQGADAAHRPGLRGSGLTVEPLRELYKDEIRGVAERLEMPDELLHRTSFPGSGLARRILGAVPPARLETLRAAGNIFNGEVRDAGLDKRMRQHFVVLAPMPGEHNRAVVILRALQSGDDAAFAARMPYDLLERVTQRILAERAEVCRVVYDLSPSTRSNGAEWQ